MVNHFDILESNLKMIGKNTTDKKKAIIFGDRVDSLVMERAKAGRSFFSATTPRMKNLLQEKIYRLTREIDNIIEK